MSRHVLLIVTDLFFVARVRETAKSVGVQIEESGVAGALERMQARKPDLVIVDLQMPGDPIALVAAARQSPALGDVEWIGYYSHVDDATRRRAIAAGVDHVLPRSAFTRRLAELLRPDVAPS